jgi:hypothetical protein
MILDTGICKVFKLVNTAAAGDKPNQTKQKIADAWYGELSYESRPVQYTESQEQVEISMRIRILRNRNITEKAIVEIAGEDYQVVRVFNGIDDDSGEPISDLSLTRLEGIYDT